MVAPNVNNKHKSEARVKRSLVRNAHAGRAMHRCRTRFGNRSRSFKIYILYIFRQRYRKRERRRDGRCIVSGYCLFIGRANEKWDAFNTFSMGFSLSCFHCFLFILLGAFFSLAFLEYYVCVKIDWMHFHHLSSCINSISHLFIIFIGLQCSFRNCLRSFLVFRPAIDTRQCCVFALFAVTELYYANGKIKFVFIVFCESCEL